MSCKKAKPINPTICFIYPPVDVGNLWIPAGSDLSRSTRLPTARIITATRIDRSAAIIACGSLVSRVIDHVDLNKEECGLRAEATTTPLMKARAFLAGRPD
jgi:hypothetical protein